MASLIGGKNWTLEAIKIAKEKGEACDHTTAFNIFIGLNDLSYWHPMFGGDISRFNFYVSCNECKKRFPETCKKLTLEFKKIFET